MEGVFGSPEEAMSAMRAMHDRGEMEASEYRHSVLRLFRDLSEDQLRTLSILIGLVGSGSNPAAAAGYYEGIINMVMESKFKICPACGEDHSIVPASMSEGVNDRTTPEVSKMENAAATEYANDLKEWGLEVLDNGALVCSNCKMNYVSLNDRQLKEKGIAGCPGCIHKEKFG